jgi:hypothetical protein
LEQGYLKNQGLWKTLIDSDGGNWSDPQDDGIGAFEIFF